MLMCKKVSRIKMDLAVTRTLLGARGIATRIAVERKRNCRSREQKRSSYRVPPAVAARLGNVGSSSGHKSTPACSK